MIIYHITTAAAWKQANIDGFYEPASLQSEGFIHCSTQPQVKGVLERYFSGQSGLLKLVIDTDKLNSRLTFDMSPSINETFPHIYGTLNLDAVIGVSDVAD